MKKIAIITPVILNSPDVARIYASNLRTYASRLAELDVYLICNKFNIELLSELQKKFSFTWVSTDQERSVAGAWNRGFQLASTSLEYAFYHVLACDIALHPDCIDDMIKFGQENTDVDLWSSTDIKSGKAQHVIGDGCDFSSFMFRAEAIKKFGWFDRQYKPAYFEDNDYAERVTRLGGKLKTINYATHYHYGSLTINADAEAKHHVDHWFEINKKRFASKFTGDNWNNPIDNPTGGIHE